MVLVGDLNSDDDTVAGERHGLQSFLTGAGMVERSTGNPLSCCIDSPVLEIGKGGDITQFDHQVDHVMTRDPALIGLKSSDVTGRHPVNMFWDSDHAGRVQLPDLRALNRRGEGAGRPSPLPRA